MVRSRVGRATPPANRTTHACFTSFRPVRYATTLRQQCVPWQKSVTRRFCRKTRVSVQLHVVQSNDQVSLGGVLRRFRRWPTATLSSRGVRSANGNIASKYHVEKERRFHRSRFRGWKSSQYGFVRCKCERKERADLVGRIHVKGR